MRSVLANIVFILLFVLLIVGVMQMPTEASVNAPAYNEVVDYYINNAANETNASNLIAAILADYRAFDTLGETIVLFTSVVAVGSVLRSTKHDRELAKEKKEDE
jgi:multicomponent Na+:H+ antiporter subunit B